MSDPSNNNSGKTLLPEFLPAPSASDSGPTQTPRQRVAERAQIFLQRFRGVGTMAGAAVLSLQCSGYGVVDPLPPPSQMCSARPDPFAQLTAQAFLGDRPDAGLTPVVLDLHARQYPGTFGFRVIAVRVTGGDLVSVQDQTMVGVYGNSRFLITATPAQEIATLLFDIDLGCGAATATKRYRMTILAGAQPGVSLPIMEVAGDADAGAD